MHLIILHSNIPSFSPPFTFQPFYHLLSHPIFSPWQIREKSPEARDLNRRARSSCASQAPIRRSETNSPTSRVTYARYPTTCQLTQATVQIIFKALIKTLDGLILVTYSTA